MCTIHETQLAAKCRVVGCDNNRVDDTLACLIHASSWRKHVKEKSKSTISGIRRILQRPGEQEEWHQPQPAQAVQAHDADQPAEEGRKHYFSPNRFYCVETLCAPCGVVVAWTKFDKSESPTKILNWLGVVYPDQDSRPSYVCIDKACQVVRTALTSGLWQEWKQTTRFIVDSYHYINHKANDLLCRTWCNPTPSDGSAPNLIGERVGPDGVIRDVSMCFKENFLANQMFRFENTILKPASNSMLG